MTAILPPAWNLPSQIVSRFGASVGRQRAMSADGHLLLVLHAPPQRKHDHREGRLFWRDAAGNWLASPAGRGVQALEALLNDYADRIDKLETGIENARQAEDYYRQLQQIAPLHRSIRHLHATLQQARELAPGDRGLITMRDRAADLERAVELLHADARLGLDFTAARQAEEQSQRMYDMAVAAHRLNLLASIFLPLVCITSLFGMNLPNGLEDSRPPLAFAVVLVSAFVSGIVLTALVLRRPRGMNQRANPRMAAPQHAGRIKPRV